MSVSVQFKGSREVVITHANSDKNKQIFMAAEAIWGITADKLPQAKFDALKTVLEGNLTREYGTYRVKGFGNSIEGVKLFPLFPQLIENDFPAWEDGHDYMRYQQPTNKVGPFAKPLKFPCRLMNFVDIVK